MPLAPQLVQYQGSKRKLAPTILEKMPESIGRLVEPFSGMAAITIAAATEGRAEQYWVNDINAPVISVLRSAVEDPQSLYESYKHIWDEQHTYDQGHVAHFYFVRDRYNCGDHSPAVTLYLLARCVKGAVRYGSNGNFNQSPDKRRHGTSPERILKTSLKLSKLLSGKTKFTSMDYRDILPHLSKADFVYMDPPYQGVTNTRDHRYLAGVEFDDLVQYLESLNGIGCQYILSYDGSLGDKTYGKVIPESLACKRLLVNAGQSTQATLLGKKETTYEGLYLSKGLY